MTDGAADAYLDELEPERRAVLAPVVELVRTAVPAGYEESLAHGMPTWSVPLARLPRTYNGEPLPYVAVAAQKRHFSLYLMGLYAGVEQELDFRRRWTASGRALDMGKSCLRFRALDDLDTELLAEAIASTGVDDDVALYESVRSR
jgi:hypothetical protein